MGDFANTSFTRDSLLYHETIILLNRPFLGHSEPQGSRTSPGLTPSTAQRNCFHAASDIYKILTVYRRQYGLRRAHVHMVHVVMSAALIHSYFCSRFVEKEEPLSQGFLLTCLQSLGEMGQTYRVALRALEIIISLRNNWQNDAFDL
jgi:hypothetical protein